MKILIYIIFAIVAVVLVFIVGVAVVTFYRLAAGKISKEEQECILEADRRKKDNKRRRKQSKSGGSFHFLSYPSPLNHWNLWH